LDMIHTAGLISREHPIESDNLAQVKDLDDLPIPDFQDYFEQMAIIGKKRPFQPKLPMEISRGCWWKKCNFCNLNLQWKGYRMKSPKRIAKELDTLIKTYQVLSISFMDNLLPVNIREILRHIFELKRDLRLFAEIRAVFSLILEKDCG